MIPCGSDDKESVCQAGDLSLIPGLGRPRGKRNGHPLRYSSLGNPMDRGAWRATVHEAAKESDTTEQPNSNKNNSALKIGEFYFM